MERNHSAMENSLTEHYPFSFPPLPYAHGALSPALNSATLHYHHGKHLKAYTDQLNTAIHSLPALWDVPLTDLLRDPLLVPPPQRTAVLRSAGGVYNHRLYFCAMTPRFSRPDPALQQAINADFGSQEALLEQMKQTGLSVFGSGWAWLVKDASAALRIVPSANQDCPLTVGLQPILPLDVWEHAYYLWYQNRRDDYIRNWCGIINWNFVSCLFEQE